MSARVRILLMASLAAAHAAPVPAQEAAVLWPTALFGGARTVGLGGSYVGLSDDINATASNPAGLVTLPRSFEVDAALGQLRPGLRPSFFGLGFHPNRWAAVDVSVGLGLEISHPLGRCFSGCGGMVQLRAGLANRGRQPGGALLEGRRMVWTTGGALALQQVMTGKLRLEMAWREETRAFMAGLGLRFPSSYRGDLENHARRR